MCIIKKILLVVAVTLINISAFAQCAGKMEGTYIINGDSTKTTTLAPRDSASDWFTNFAILGPSPFAYYIPFDCTGGVPNRGANSYDWTFITWGSYTLDTILLYENAFDPGNNKTEYHWVLTRNSPPMPSNQHGTAITIQPEVNPVSQILYFTVNASNLPAVTLVRIFNMQGQCVYYADCSIYTGQQVGINVENLAQGMYILEISMPKHVFYKLKFLKK